MADGTTSALQAASPCPTCGGRADGLPPCDDCVARHGHPARWQVPRLRSLWDDDEEFCLVEAKVTRRGLAELLAVGGATTYAVFKAPRALLALRARIPTAQLISVGPEADDDCATIGEALAVAGPEATVVVSEGTYRESLLVRNGVFLKAARGRRVEIAPPDGPAITVIGGDPVIQGLVLRAAPHADLDLPAPVVLVTGGSPVVRNCEVWFAGSDGIVVQGTGTSARVESTKVHGGDRPSRDSGRVRAAVRFDRGTTGTVEKCTLAPSGDTWIGVHVDPGAAPIVRETKVITTSGGTGLNVWGGRGTFDRCVVEARVGMSVQENGQPFVHQTSFTGCAVGLDVAGPNGGTYEACTFEGWSPAVKLRASASPVFDGCTVTARGSGVVMGEGADPLFRRTPVHSLMGEAVVAEVGARGLFDQCDVGKVAEGGSEPWQMDPKVAAVSLGKRASTQFVGCTIAFGPGPGVAVAPSGGGTFEDCQIHGHVGPGMTVGLDAHPLVRGGLIARNGGDGVRVLEGGRGTFKGCTIDGNRASGLHLEARADPVVRDCQVTGNGEHGVVVGDGAIGRITGCTFDRNASGDWLVGPGARAQLLGNARNPA